MTHHFNPRTPYGVRLGRWGILYFVVHISIHAPHTECDMHLLARWWTLLISIHAPHTECDSRAFCSSSGDSGFQSTHPIRSATLKAPSVQTSNLISIHAPHTECDLSLAINSYYFRDFNPRTPYGVRHGPLGMVNDIFLFQSTHPIRSATQLFSARYF